MRVVASERRIPAERWHTVVPVVEHALNTTPRELLGGCSPLEVCLARPARALVLDIVVAQSVGAAGGAAAWISSSSVTPAWPR